MQDLRLCRPIVTGSIKAEAEKGNVIDSPTFVSLSAVSASEPLVVSYRITWTRPMVTATLIPRPPSPSTRLDGSPIGAQPTGSIRQSKRRWGNEGRGRQRWEASGGWAWWKLRRAATNRTRQNSTDASTSTTMGKEEGGMEEEETGRRRVRGIVSRASGLKRGSQHPPTPDGRR